MADERCPQLVLLDESAQVFELPEGTTRIGRAPGNEMRLEDTTVSRFHCHVVRCGREVRVEDADSHNSTRVNGQRATESPLQSGDVLRVGRLRLRYVDPETSTAAAAPALKRDLYAARMRGPALFPLLCLLIAVLGLSWLYIASSFTRRASSPAVAVGSRGDVGLTSELLETQRQLRMQSARLDEVRNRFSGAQASLNALEKNYKEELAALRLEYDDGRGRDRDKELFRQILSLESTIRELQEQREADRKLFEKQLAEAGHQEAGHQEAGSQEVGQQAAGDEAGDGIESGDGSRSRTSVSGLQSRPALSKKEVAGLVETLQRSLESYASVEATPESLEPALGSLSAAGGREAAKGLLAVFQHARDLLADIDENVAFLKRRTDKLLADAQAANGESAGEGSEKKEGSAYTAGPELEKLQRALELSDRKIDIKKAQRERLVALRDAVKASFERATDPGAVRYFAGVFADDRDVEKRLAVLVSLRASSSPEAVPALLGRFSTRDEALRKAVRAALIAIAGKDLGPSKQAWEEWWSEQRL